MKEIVQQIANDMNIPTWEYPEQYEPERDNKENKRRTYR